MTYVKIIHIINGIPNSRVNIPFHGHAFVMNKNNYYSLKLWEGNFLSQKPLLIFKIKLCFMPKHQNKSCILLL